MSIDSDDETMQFMTQRLDQIRERHQQSRANLLNSFNNLRRQAKEAIELNGQVAMVLR